MWKPVEIDGSVFSKGFEGLVGIEECTDYNLNHFHSSKKRKLSKTLQKKKIGHLTKSGNIVNTTKKSYVKSEPVLPSKIGYTSTVPKDVFLQQELEENVEENVEGFESWNTFGIHKLILKGLITQKFQQPTEIQSLTFPAAIFGKRDILGAAETGSGKTLAFGIPILNGILKLKEKESEISQDISDSSEASDLEFDNDEIGCVKVNKLENYNRQKPLYALILTPTRELAIQIKNHLISIAKFTGINVAVIVGGMAAVKQERILSKGPEIVVATPGRLWELIQQGNSHLSQVDNIRFLAIDETDRMLEKGHFQELHDILERINLDEENKKQRQNFVFSATLTLIHDLPKHLINKSKITKFRKIHEMTPEQKLQRIIDMLGITNPKVVDLSKGTGTSGTLTECRINCNIDEKDYYVYYFLKKHPGRTLIFCNSIGCVKRLTTLLTLLDCSPMPLHASMQQRQRLKNLERFTSDENSILIATDVAARGLDIPSIEHVIHYQTPRTSEGYVHRSGRTARASNRGITVLLIEPNELTSYFKLCKTLGKAEDISIFPVEENFLNAVKQRVNLTRELDKLQLQVKKANSEAGWLQKAADDMDIIVDDISKKYDTEETKSYKRIAEIKRKQLATLLAKPIFPKGFSGKYPVMEQLNNQREQKQETAIDVMQKALESSSKEKKKVIRLYKPNKKGSNGGVVGKLNKFKKDKYALKQKLKNNKNKKHNKSR